MLGLIGSSLSAATPAFAKDGELDMAKRCGSGFGKGETVGTVAGAATGAVIGALIGDESDAVIGAVLGGLLGNRAGNSWDKDKCEKAREAMTLALASGESSELIPMSNNGRSQYSYQITNSFAREQSMELPVLEGRTVDTTGVLPARGVYQIRQTVTVRGKPTTTESQVFGTLAPDTKVVALGISADAKWLLVSSTGSAAEGWIFASNAASTSDDQAAFMKANVESRPVQVVTVTNSIVCRDGHHQLVEGRRTLVSANETTCQEGGDWRQEQSQPVNA
ncbi:MAG TPA: glycine zipper domain-containing protein [Croceibacterium sp.]